jgi:hypothetical protein
MATLNQNQIAGTKPQLVAGEVSPGVYAVLKVNPDGSLSVADTVISGNVTAVLDGRYVNVANATYTDPATPAEGKGFEVFVRNGTATVGGVAYSQAGLIIRRIWHSGSYVNYVDRGSVTATGTTAGIVPGIGGTAAENVVTLGQSAAIGRGSSAILFTDFITGGFSGSLGTTGDGFTFGTGVSGAGSSVTKANINTGTAVGVVVLEAGTTTTGRAAIDTWGSGNTFSYGSGEVYWETRVRIPTLSDATEEFQIAAGHCFVNNATLANNGCGFIYNRAVNGANWQAISRSAGSQTTTNTNVAVAGNTWVKLAFRVNAAGTSVEYFINGVSVATITTNIGAQADREGAWIIKSAGTTSRTLQIDYWFDQQTFTTPR